MTKRVVLIGHPVAHSLSGAMQQAAFDELGIDARYELWDRTPMALGEAIIEIRSEDFLGANVIARRWSSRLSVGAPARRRPPWISRSSPSTSTWAPIAERPAATPAIRSDSL